MSDPITVKAGSAAAVSAMASAATMDWSTAMFGVPITVILAAFAGAVLALAVLPKMQNWQMGVAVATGTFAGIYGSQLILLWVAWPPHALPPTAWASGLTGQLLVSMVFKDGRTLAIAWVRKMLGLPEKEGEA